MAQWENEVSGAAVGVLAMSMMLAVVVVGAVVIGGLSAMTVQGYQTVKRRHDPPHLGPWSEPGDVSEFGYGGLHLGEEMRWD